MRNITNVLVGTAKKLRAQHRERHRLQRVATVTSFLEDRTPPDTKRSESEFNLLQERYPKRPEYGWDLSSLFQRAALRGSKIHQLANSGDRRLKLLDIGAGDGMLGALLAAAGHNITLCDLEDWRADAAKGLRFAAADCCIDIPFDTGEFDFVCSFNSFEHFSDPKRVFDEALRVTKSGGLMYFEFGPLYRSPWGLHAYSALMMPYPQFLFSDDFISSKLAQLGIWDLGTKRAELQNLNKWTSDQFAELWRDSACKVVSYEEYIDESHVDLICAYPSSFSGRDLTYKDVTCIGLSITLQKL